MGTRRFQTLARASEPACARRHILDFSDNEWHFTLEGALKIANSYPDTPLLLSHWGTVDAPGFTPFNADPENLKRLVRNPERVVVLTPGEGYTLKPLRKP